MHFRRVIFLDLLTWPKKARTLEIELEGPLYVACLLTSLVEFCSVLGCTGTTSKSLSSLVQSLLEYAF